MVTNYPQVLVTSDRKIRTDARVTVAGLVETAIRRVGQVAEELVVVDADDRHLVRHRQPDSAAGVEHAFVDGDTAIALASGGRMLALFTSNSALRRARSAMRCKRS